MFCQITSSIQKMLDRFNLFIDFILIMNQRKIIFMGTPKIAATVLQSLLDANIAIELVVTQPDKKVGRKQILTYSAVKEVAMEHSIQTFQPRRIKDDYLAILDIQADLIITWAYGQLVPDCILQAPIYGSVSLLGS